MVEPYYETKLGKLYCGKNLEILPTLPENSVDCCITDPPYELGFMGKKWDSSGIAYNVDLWREVLRVLKPGGHLLAFGGTRTHHRLICAIEDAGFEIRDMVTWAYGSGFPKSLDISKALDAKAGVEREVVGQKAAGLGTGSKRCTPESTAVVPDTINISAPATEAAKQWEGYGTALKPAIEPICLARKPINGTVADNVLKHGTGGLNIDKCRVGWQGEADRAAGRPASFSKAHDGFDGQAFKIADRSHRDPSAEQHTQGRFPANLILTYPEDEYILRDDVTPNQLHKLAEWMNENTQH